MITEIEFPGAVRAPLDVAGLLPAHLARKRPPREDEDFAHFTDIGKCDRQIHARRSRRYSNAVADRLQFMFAVGHYGEAEMLAALRARYEPDGWTVNHGGLLVAIVDTADIEFRWHTDLEGFSWAHDLDPDTTVIGHPDFFLTHPKLPSFVVDAKTTQFPFQNGVRTPPGTTRQEYVLQAAGYAVALDEIYHTVETFGIWSACRGGGGDELIAYRTADYKPLVLRRLRELVLVTSPRAPEPDPVPPNYTMHTLTRGPRKGMDVSDMCEWCANLSCPANSNLGEGE